MLASSKHKMEGKREITVGIYLQRTAMTNVMAGSMLLMAQEKVGDVNLRPA